MAETDSRILEYLEEGLFLYGVGKVQESIVRWRKVLELDPRNERAMDYIESAGGDVSQYRAKAKAGPAPAPTGPQPAAQPAPVAQPSKPAAPAPEPPAAIAPLPGRNVQQPSEPLDVAAFLAATGAAPKRMTPAPTSSPMPWQSQATGTQPAVTAPPPAMPSITTSATVPSAPPPMPVAAPPPMPAVAPPPMQPVMAPPPMQQPVAPPPQPRAPTPPPQRSPREQLIAEAGVLFQGRQFEQSLEVLERVAKEFPPVDDALRQYLEAARNGLYEVLKQQWPRPDLIPELRMNPQQVMALKLSPEAGFIFSRIDGVSNVEEILAMGGLDPFTTLRALSQLMRAGVIGVQG